MSDRSEDRRRDESDVSFDAQARRTDEPAAPAVFNPKGIGSNVLLTAAAAVVPMMIVGIAGVRAVLGAKGRRR